MTTLTSANVDTACAPARHYDVLVIGAGFGGIRVLHEMRHLGLSARVLEAGSDVGGTWYWNRYPGARTDTESWAYCFSFSKELQEEWDWPERMPTWEHVQAYMRHVVDRFDMRKDMQFETRVTSAVYDEPSNLWTLTTAAGEQFTCTYFISASGLLSVPVSMPFKGLDTFKGEHYISARWPKTPVDLTGKRVAIVGSGSTAVQILPIAAQTAKSVTMFQRTPNYVLPGRNHPLDDAQRQAIRSSYDEIWAQTRKHVMGFPIVSPRRVYDDVTDAQRQQIFEAGWETGGFRFIFETFDDILLDARSNAAASEFVRNKIRAIVKDPATAELLCPDYPIFVKRPPVGNFYFESFNRPNVSLVDISNDPIQEVTSTGLRTSTREFEFDVIIFAMGFDAGTGALTAIDVRGKANESLKEKWAGGPQTNLGIAVDGYPNMFMISGPQSPFANIPPIVEGASEWIGKVITHARTNGRDRIETTHEASDAWSDHVQHLLEGTLLGQGAELKTWFMGSNVEGKAQKVLFYFGGAGGYFKALNRSIESDFSGFTFTAAPSAHCAVPAEAVT